MSSTMYDITVKYIHHNKLCYFWERVRIKFAQPIVVHMGFNNIFVRLNIEISEQVYLYRDWQFSSVSWFHNLPVKTGRLYSHNFKTRFIKTVFLLLHLFISSHVGSTRKWRNTLITLIQWNYATTIGNYIIKPDKSDLRTNSG